MTESRKKRNASKLAWLLSFGIHVVIGVLAFFVTWSVINLNNKNLMKQNDFRKKGKIRMDAILKFYSIGI